MWDIFSEMKNMGVEVEGVDKSSLYDLEDTSKKGDKTDATKADVIAAPIDETEYIFDKNYKCPICSERFIAKTVRTGKIKLVSSDMDLKPNYAELEPIKYDVVACPHCGYASLTRNWDHITDAQAKLVKAGITSNFKGIKSSGKNYYTFSDAKDRYMLALMNAIVMKFKNSERAYIMLKLAWLYRYEYKQRMEDDIIDGKLLAALKEREAGCILDAYKGFRISMEKEMPPICGMDSNTLTFLLSDLARQCKDYETSRKLVGSILVSRSATSRLKERARQEKELLLAETGKGDSE